MIKLRNNCTKIINEHTKTRVAYIFNHSYFLGGGEISFYELIRSLDKKLYEPVIFVPEKGEIRRKLLSHNYKVDIILLPPLKKIFMSLPFRAICKLTRLINSKNIDLIHVNGSRACLYGCLAGWILNIPVAWHVRETIKDYILYEYFLIMLSKVIICVSKSVKKKRFGKFNKKIQNKIHVVYNGVNTAKFNFLKRTRHRVRRDLGIDKQLLIGIIGNIAPLKGQDFFIKAFAEAKGRNPNLRAKVLIIGRSLDINYDKKIHQLVYDFGLEDEVIFKTYSENILEIFSALDIFALPSKREGFSRSLIEAMSMSLPVLATKISEIEEAVLNGENAILANFNDTENLALAIIQLYEDKKLREKMGVNNRKRVAAEFDLVSHTKSIVNIYDKFLH